MEQNIAETAGIVEDVLDRNGEEESSKSRGVVVLQRKAEKKKKKNSFSTKAKAFCVPALYVVFEY